MKKLFTFILACLFTSAAFAQQIPNQGFETWQTKFGVGFTGPYTYDLPQNWKLGFVSELISGFGIKPNIGKGTPSQAGNFALKLFSTADSIGADAQCTFALPANSGSGALTGFFKTSGVVTDPNDYGHAMVFMTRWNGTSRDTIGIGGADLASSPNGYNNFIAPIQYTSTLSPDSAIVYFLYFPEEANTNIMIDNLSFITLLGNKKEVAATNQFTIFPNPATDKVTLTFNAAKAENSLLTIRDLTGKEVKTLTLDKLAVGSNSVTIPLEGLKKGMYLATLQTKNGAQTMRFVKQ